MTDPSSPNFFQVKEIFQSENVFEAIGIIPERAEEIERHVEKIWTNAMQERTKQKSEIISELTSICKNPAETFFIGTYFIHLEAAERAHHMAVQMSQSVADRLKQIDKDFEDED